MAIGVRISVKEQGPGTGLEKFIESLDKLTQVFKNKTEINHAIALFAKKEVRDHLYQYNASHPNQLGGPRTNWYAKAANATNIEFDASKAVVGISQVGIRLQILGGKVTPGKNPSSATGLPTKNLSIPAVPEAHGKTPAEFANLMFVPAKNKGGNVSGMLMEFVGGAAQLKKKKVTKKGRLPILPFNSEGGIGPGLFGVRRVIFWLVKSATIGPHPDVIPPREKLLDAATAGVNAMYQNVMKQKNQQPPQ